MIPAFVLLQHARVWGDDCGGFGKRLRLAGPACGEPVLGLARGRSQIAVLLYAQDLPGGLAHKGRAAVDPDYPVGLGQLGDAEGLLVGQRQRLHCLLLSLDRTFWRNLQVGEGGSPQTAREGVPPRIAAAANRNASRRITAPPLSFVVAGRVDRLPRARPRGHLRLQPHGLEGFGTVPVHRPRGDQPVADGCDVHIVSFDLDPVPTPETASLDYDDILTVRNHLLGRGDDAIKGIKESAPEVSGRCPSAIDTCLDSRRARPVDLDIGDSFASRGGQVAPVERPIALSTTSTFSCDTAYSVSPTALRASAWSKYSWNRIGLPPFRVATYANVS